MIGTSNRIAICAAMMGLGVTLVACGDPDDPVDGGRRDTGTDPVDAGQDGGDPIDSGMEDGGQDAGPPPNANLRLAHMIANVPGPAAAMGAVHLCLRAAGAPADGPQLLITRNDAGAAPIPYGGVSPYTDALTLPPITFNVYVYGATTVTGTDCPASSEALFSSEVDASELVGGNSYTIAAVGRIGSETEAPGLVVIQDNNSDPAADMTRVRVVHAITAIPTPAVDVCYDPDIMLGAVEVAGEMPGEELAMGVAYVGGATMVLDLPYSERGPVTSGALLIYARTTATGTNCADATGATRLAAIPLPFPVPPDGTPGYPVNLTDADTLDAGEVATLFFRGHAGAPSVVPLPCTAAGGECAAMAGAVCHPIAMRCVHPEAPSLTPWIDNVEPAAP
ncbi:MAG: DUF4397 domain-containing protein [Myxococcota bacterium]|nr:DUF4397 domain-containing protein [Myxococcota bacterium]